MQMIVDEAYYKKYAGDTIGDFARLNGVSQSFIEYLTRKTADELKKLPEAMLVKVKDAICAEVEFLSTLGGVQAVNSKQDLKKTSESYAGSYSYSVDSKNVSEVKYVNGVPYAPMIDVYLMPTGLLYAGVDYV